jgi:hypothetical protein
MLPVTSAFSLSLWYTARSAAASVARLPWRSNSWKLTPSSTMRLLWS